MNRVFDSRSTKFLSVEGRKDLEKKARNHPRLKYFVHTYHEDGLYEKFKRYIFPGPIGFLFRCIMVVAIFTIHYLIQRVIFLGYKNWDKPAKTRRWFSIWACRIVIRIFLFFAGFHWIEFIDHTKNRKKSKKAEDLPCFEYDQRWPMLSSHNTAFDITMQAALLGSPSFVSKDELLKVPMVGFKLKALRGVLVHREKAQSSTQPSTFQSLQERICNPAEGEYTPLVYAEGTTDNGESLLRFHTGAFLGGNPVRPILLSYPHQHRSLNWESVPFTEVLYDMFTQFHNRCRLEVLDLYLPTPAEKADAQLYADNVGRMMAEKMGRSYVTTVGYPEKLAMLALLQGRLAWEDVDVEMRRIDAEREAKEKARRIKMKKMMVEE